MQTYEQAHLKYTKEKTIELAKMMGLDGPLNPMGTCFVSAIKEFHEARKMEQSGRISNLQVVHAIATCNVPGEEGTKIGHAWLEWVMDGVHVAFDVIWGVILPREEYYKQLKATKILRYTKDEVVRNMLAGDNISLGPWDLEIHNIAVKSLEKT